MKALLAPFAGKLTGGLIALLVALSVFFYISWTAAAHSRDMAKQENKRLGALVELLRVDREIAETASLERAVDDIIGDSEREELRDASNQPGDDSLAARVRRLCVLRRQQGGVDGLPAECRRLDGQVRAPDY